MLLAGDIGGTKTLLGLFDPASVRPRPVVVRSFPTLEFDDLASMITAFVKEDEVKHASIDAACFGVAEPVIGDATELTNVTLRNDAQRMAADFSLLRVNLLK